MSTSAFIGIVGTAVFAAINVWCLLACSKELLGMINSGQSVDRTLSPLYKEDNPRLFYMQAAGFAALILCNVAILLGIAIAIIQSLTS